jgi:hypothetical protein
MEILGIKSIDEINFEIINEWKAKKNCLFKAKAKYRKAKEQIAALISHKSTYLAMHNAIEGKQDELSIYHQNLLKQKLQNFPNLEEYLLIYMNRKADEIFDLEIELYEQTRENVQQCPPEDDHQEIVFFEAFRQKRLLDYLQENIKQQDQLKVKENELVNLLEIPYFDNQTFDSILWTSSQFMDENFGDIVSQINVDQNVNSHFTNNGTTANMNVNTNFNFYNFENLSNEIETIRQNLPNQN